MEPRPRMTEQRRVILEELSRERTHPTADELFQMVRRRMPRISLGTVYRNLERLAAEGVIRKIDYPGSRMRFDAERGGHHHIRCVICGRIDDIEEAEGSTGGDDRLLAGTGYKYIERRIEYLGVCPGYAEKGDGNQ